MEHDKHRWRVQWASWLDLWAICRLERTVFAEPLSIWSATRYWLTPLTGYLVIRKGRRIAAYFGFEVMGPVAHVLANVTAPQDRREGLGGAILRAGEIQARRLGARWLMGEVRVSNINQMRVLKRLGWKPAATVPHFFADGEDAVVYWRVLDDL